MDIPVIPVDIVAEETRRSPLARIAAVAVALLLLGDVAALVTVGGGPLTTTQIASRVNAAASRALAEHTAHVAMAIDATAAGLGQNIHMVMNGSFDFAQKDFDMTMSILGLHEEVRLVDNVAYLLLPPQARTGLKITTPWVAFPVPTGALAGGSSTALSGSGAANTLEQLIAASKGAVTAAHKVGTEEVNGVSTTHYVLVLDPAKVQAEARDAATKAFPFAPSLEIKAMTMDAWIDHAGQLRRINSVADIGAAGQVEHVTETIDYSDYGVPVDIVAPPASQVTRLASLSQLVPGARS